VNLARLVFVVLRFRSHSTEELFRQVARTDVSRKRRGRGDTPPLRRVRAVQRLLCGFSNPLRENAMAALALRPAGYPVDLVVGCEPVPISGGRRLIAWLEVEGKTEGTTLPARIFYPELWRFPAS
jgi:hypothetical protein